MGLALALPSKAVTLKITIIVLSFSPFNNCNDNTCKQTLLRNLVVVDGSLNIALALESPFVEVGRDGGDGGAAKVLLVESVRQVEVVLPALLDKPVGLVHRVVRLQQVWGEVGGGDCHHVLHPGPVRPVVHELDVELLRDPEMSRLLVCAVFEDGTSTALAGRAGRQWQNRFVNGHVRNRDSYVASLNCVLLDRPVGDVHLQVEQGVIRLVVVHHENVVIRVGQLVVVVGGVLRAVTVDVDQRGVWVVNSLWHLSGRFLIENARWDGNHCRLRAGESFRILFQNTLLVFPCNH